MNNSLKLSIYLALGLTVGTGIAAILGWVTWQAAISIVPFIALFFFIAPSSNENMSARTISVVFWICVGSILVPMIVLLPNLLQYLGWVALAWIIASFVAGILWPLPNAKKLADERSYDQEH